MPAGQVYLSAIDLNIENGKVVRPYKPMLRLATPALDAAGNRDGILVIDVLMTPLLEAAAIPSLSGPIEIAVLNARGYWLRAVDPADEWGFVLGRETTLASRNPALWKRVGRQERGQWPDSDGLWAWHTVHSPVAGSPDAPWVVLARQPLGPLMALERSVWLEGGAIVLMLLVLLGLLCRTVVHRRAQHDAALVDLGRSQAEAEVLRQHVIEVQRHEAVSALLAAIVNSSEDAIFSTDAQGLITSWNPGAERLLGYSSGEVIGQPVTLLCPTQADGKALPADHLAGSDGVRRLEAILRHRNGERIEVAATLSPIRDAGGRLTGTSCNLHDIREQKRVARELALHRDHLESLVSQRTADLAAAKATVEERERFFRTITDNLPGMISYWDADLHCRFANRTYEEWFGLSPEEMLRVTLPGLLGEKLYASSRPFAEAALKGLPQRYERALTKVDGRIGHIMVQLVPDLQGGAVRGLFALVTDVTLAKEAESSLRQANAELSAALDQAAAATAAKSVFLANMSHEIRTPMNAVLGMAFLLEKADLPPEAAKLAHRIHRAGRSLLTILDDILNFSRIESGQLVLEQEPFRLDEVFDNLATIMAGAAAEKDIELAVAPPPPGLGTLRGDALRLGQVLLNLTANAINFTVRDTGIGIPVDKQEEIFNAFSQADASTTRRSGGTGLGLAICRRLVVLMGGEIGGRSQPGQGSEFWFTLPVDRCVAAATTLPGPAQDLPSVESRDEAMEQPDLAAPTRLAGVRVLVVDDSAINREVARAILVRDGAHVELAGDGREALQVLSSRPRDFDIVLMDVQMPVMDGYEAARAIRAHPALAGLPVVAVTAGAYKAQEEAARAAGMDDFIAKPFDVDGIVALILRRLRPERPPSPPGQAAGVTPPGDDAYPGLDIPKGLALWKDAQAYRHFLRQFADDFGACADTLRRASPAESGPLVHRLKGAAGSLHIVDVAECATRLDQALRKGLPTGPLVDALQAALDAALDSIRRYAPETSAAASRTDTDMADSA